MLYRKFSSFSVLRSCYSKLISYMLTHYLDLTIDCKQAFLSISAVPYLLTYLLNPWCRVLLEKLTGLQLVKKLPAFH